MNCPGIFNPLLRNRLLSLFFCLIPVLGTSQAAFSDAKNSWHKGTDGWNLKKMGIYSTYENMFFLKKKEKRPSQEEHWVIFGEMGGEFTIYRDSNFFYSNGELIYGQEEISVSSEVGSEPVWVMKSASDTLYLSQSKESINLGLCRLFRTIQVRGTARKIEQKEEVDLMTIKADLQKLKRFSVSDLTPGDDRFIPFKIMAIFLYAHTLGKEVD